MLKVEVRGIQDALRSLPTQQQLRRAGSQALNRIGRGVMTEVDRGIREDYTVKRADIMASVSQRQANVNSLVYIIGFKSKPLPLTKFRVTVSGKRPRKGVPSVRAQVLRKGGLKPIGHGFRAQMKTGHVGIFTRVGKARLPIKQLYGPSVRAMAMTDSVLARAEKRVRAQYGPEFARALERQLKM